MDLTEDKELYLKLKEGDERAFQTLFRKYYSAMCHFASQFLNDSELAEEIVQDMFVKIWEKRASLNIETSVKHYLFRSVRNQCLNQIQHEKIKKQLETFLEEELKDKLPITVLPDGSLIFNKFIVRKTKKGFQIKKLDPPWVTKTANVSENPTTPQL